MPVGLVDKTPHGGWLLICMMSFLSSFTAVWFAIFVFWGLPLFWLSLHLKRLAAPKQEPQWSRFCWQPTVFQTERDEVKGKNPFVNEEMLSETSLPTYVDCSRGVYRVAWCFGAGVWPCYHTYAYPFAFLIGYWFCCWTICWARLYRVLCATSYLQLWQPHYLAGSSSVQTSPEHFTWNSRGDPQFSRCWAGLKGTRRSQFLLSWQPCGVANRLNVCIRSFSAPVSTIELFQFSLSYLVASIVPLM